MRSRRTGSSIIATAAASTGNAGRIGTGASRQRSAISRAGFPKGKRRWSRLPHELLQPPAIARRASVRGDVVAGLLSGHPVAGGPGPPPKHWVFLWVARRGG